MTNQEALNIIKLLSALESWAFSTKTMLPDYLHDDLCVAVKKLESIVLRPVPIIPPVYQGTPERYHAERIGEQT